MRVSVTGTRALLLTEDQLFARPVMTEHHKPRPRLGFEPGKSRSKVKRKLVAFRKFHCLRDMTKIDLTSSGMPRKFDIQMTNKLWLQFLRPRLTFFPLTFPVSSNTKKLFLLSKIHSYSSWYRWKNETRSVD